MSSPIVYLIGVRDMEGPFNEMLEAKRFCDERGLSYPAEVEAYFGDLAEENEEEIRDEMQHVTLISFDSHGPIGSSTIKADVIKDRFSTIIEFDTADIPAEMHKLRMTVDY